MKLKKFLIPFLLCSLFCFIPKTYAFTVDNTSFDNPIGYYKNLNNKIYDVANGINQFKYYSTGDYIDYIVRLTAVNPTSVSSGQLLLYVNVCYTESNYHMLQKLNYIDNSIGVVSELENIANNMNSTKGSCQTGDGSGYLFTGVWSMSYILERNQDNGYSFLDSNIYFTSTRTLNYATTFKFNNIYVTDYDENVVQNLKQQQITSATNTYLQEQIQQQQQTNEKLDDIYETITDPNLDTGTLENSAGWLPPGPVDSILNLPLSLYQNLLETLQTGQRSCPALNINLPYVDEVLSIPCLSDIFNRIDGLNVFWTWVGIIAGAFILFNYLINLYKWVDATLTLRENNHFGGY